MQNKIFKVGFFFPSFLWMLWWYDMGLIYTDLKITWQRERKRGGERERVQEGYREGEMAARQARKSKPPSALISSLGLDQMLFYIRPLRLLFLLSVFLATLQVTRAMIHHCSSESRCHGRHGEKICLRKRTATKTCVWTGPGFKEVERLQVWLNISVGMQI